MDAQEKSAVEVRDVTPPSPTTVEDTKAHDANPSAKGDADQKAADRGEPNKKGGDKNKCNKKHGKTKKSKKHKKRPEPEGDSDDSDSDAETQDTSTSDSDSSDSDSDSDDAKKKRVTKKRHDLQKSKKKVKASKKSRKPGKPQAVPVPSDTDSDSSSDTEDDDDSDRGSSHQQQRKQQQELARLMQLQQLQLQQDNSFQFSRSNQYDPMRVQINDRGRSRRAGHQPSSNRDLFNPMGFLDNRPPNPTKLLKQKRHKSPRMDFKRVDQVWDTSIHNYKLQDTAEGAADAQYDEYLFHVRRTFDWEGKYKQTLVDIKSKLLRECLQDVMGNIKGVSLVEDTPKLDPNMLFLYLEDLRKYMKGLKKAKPSATDKHGRKKEQKRIENKRQHMKVLIKYIDKDYAAVKSSLYPMLENGLITFELLWALWKPNTLAFTTTYGSHDEPRIYKVEMAEKHYSIMKGDFYYIEGKYFEYDGKQFGFGSMSEELGDFRGARKITSLNCYPLKYHKNEAQLRRDLIDRGKKFVALSGVHYKSHQGMAYYKKKKSVIKVNINGRIMIDPSIHRRINPNYPISHVRPKDHDVISDDEDMDDESGYCGCATDSDNAGGDGAVEEEGKVKYVTKLFKDDKGKVQMVRMPKIESDEPGTKEKLDKVEAKDATATEDNAEGDSTPHDDKAEKQPPEFTDEEYLIASPVVLGFAFAEKLWLEFTVSGVKEIQWNKNAYASLVLEAKTKVIVQALVESHKYHAAESIDDVIQGKGKGLVAVLHGPPGTGKTLTAEGISELLKCPLYMVSAGELGTDSRYLESELQKILDICHAWGAILLLDEADVFLEKRNMHDIHRNALVSIFLRQLEYFQGILFLTTNRVETFDDAFQSRIHIALRYANLDHKAKKAIFKIFIERVRVLEKMDLMPFSEEDYNDLARNELNGRQIKNTVRTAQALAVNKGEPLSMDHIRQVLEVQMSFDRDLKGGPGYQDAMRSYF